MNTIIQTITSNRPRVPVATTEGLYFFHPEEIIRFEASSNYTYIHFTNRKPMLIAKVLGQYEEQLSGSGFVRTHRSHLVNKQYITFIDGQGNIVMEDNSRVEISRRKKKEVMSELKKIFLTSRLAA